MDEFLDPSKNVSIRFVKDEIDFINENYERIAGTDERITSREFFFRAVQQAVSLVKPKIAEKPRPEDLQKIAELEAQLHEALADIDSKTKYIDDITARDIDLTEKIARQEDTIAGMQSIIYEKYETKPEPEPEPSLPENIMILEDMAPAEMALITEYARMMETTPKVVLVEKLFVPTVWYGPGDYIPRLKSEAKRRLQEAFK